MEGDKENIEGDKCVFGREVKGEMPKKHYLFSQHCRDASRYFINIHLSRLEAMSVFCTV